MHHLVQRRLRRATLISTACLALFTGVGLARVCLFDDALWLLVPALLCAVTIRRHSLLTLGCLVLLFAGLGWWRGSVMMHRLDPYAIYARTTVTVVGRATDDGVYGVNGQLVFGLGNLELVSPARRMLPGTITVKGFGARAVYRGDVVRATGRLYPTKGNSFASIGFAELDVEPVAPTWIEAFRHKFTAGMQTALPEPQASFGLGLLTGQRSTLPPDVAETLLMVGLTHIIAVSGYNLTIMVEVARQLCGKRSKFQTAAACVLLIAAFLLITGSSPSIVRASIISLLSIATWYYGRAMEPIALLLSAAAITVLANPAYLWGNVSWYLSFLAFFGVVVLAPLVTARMYGARKPRIVVQIIIESLCAEVMTLPYVLFIFGQLSLVGLLANIFVATLVPLAMLLGLLGGLAGMLIAPLAGWLAWPAQWLLGYMLEVAAVLAHIPYAFVEHIGFPLAMLLGSYAIVALLLVVLHGKKRRKYAIITGKTEGVP